MTCNIAFFTILTDAYKNFLGIEREEQLQIVNSAKYWHPNIPFYVFGDNFLIPQITKLPNPARRDYYSLKALYGLTVCDLAPYDLIVYMDCDMIVTDHLDTILDADYDVAAPRNNTDNNGAGCNGGYTLAFQALGKEQFVDWQHYVNAGLVASRQRQFWELWWQYNQSYARTASMADQDCLNVVFHLGVFRTKILDPKEELLYYGTAANWGTKDNKESWLDIVVQSDGLYLHNKKIKILHDAGPQQKKLCAESFQPEVWTYIDNIIKHKRAERASVYV